MIGIALAVGIGVQMGESVIGSIDPVHFRGAAPPVRAVDPAAPVPAPATYASAYDWGQGDAARLADGGPAAGSYGDFAYVPQPSLRQASAPSWEEASAPVNLAPWRPGQVSSHPDVERYTDYPIETKPAAEPAAAPEPTEEDDAPPVPDGK